MLRFKAIILVGFLSLIYLHVPCFAEDVLKVVINPKATYQTLEGYGHGNMEQRTPVWYQKYSQAQLERILDTLYTLDDKGLGLNIYRYPMPAADAPGHNHMRRLPKNANKPFEYADGKFNWTGHEDVLWMGKGAVQRGAKLWASWYGMPYWLSTSGCASGSDDGVSNNLIAGKEERFIRHIIDVMKHFRDEWAMDFDWVNPINEPEADWWKSGGGQPGSHVSVEQAILLYRELDKALKLNAFEAEIVAYDAAYTNSTTYLDKLLHSDIQPKIDVLACHQYITTESALRAWAARAKQYDKGLWMSEWGDWTNAKNKEGMQIKQMMNYAQKLHEAFEVLNANAWIMWEAGFIFDTRDTGLVKRKSYWAVAHYSRHVRPGFQRIGADCSDKNIKITAWLKKGAKDKPSKLVLVMVNSEKRRRDVLSDLSVFGQLKDFSTFQTSKSNNYQRLDVVPEKAKVQVTLSPQSVTTMECDVTF